MTTLALSAARAARRFTPALLVAGALVLLIASPELLSAQSQASELGRQGLGRAYWHVFASYAVGWLLIFGWVIAMFRKLRRVEERLTAAE